ncbi:MAG: tail fiber domain-containing protein [Ferruginibacter sp.]
MKNFLICIFFTLPALLIMNKAAAQNIAINTDGALPDASAMLDIASTGKGLLAPRMTTTQQNAISLPAKGLLIFNLTDNLFRVNTGTPGVPLWTALSTATNNWLLTGNAATNSATNFLGTTDGVDMAFRTNNLQRMVINAAGRVGVGISNPGNPLVVKDTFEIRRVGSLSEILFSNTSGSGDFRIAGDGGDIFWQGGGGRSLQMGSYWTTILTGDRQTSVLPAFVPGVTNNTGVLVLAPRDATVPLAIQANSASQTGNLTEWRNSAGTVLNMINKNGDVSIGGTAFNVANPEQLLVDAGVTNSVNAIAGKGNINNYLQLNIQNNSPGTNSSSDVVATANNGDETTNFVDMGINGGGNTSNIMGSADDSYLYNIGQNFLMGTGTSGKALMFLTGGTDSATNERMRIDGTGNVGIGVANPGYKLQVNAASNPLKLVGLQTGANTDSVLTVSNGVVRRLHPSALVTSSTNAWGLTGNAATNPSTNFIGTTDAQALVIKENNASVGRFEANSMALGTGAVVNNATHSYAIGSNAAISFSRTAAMTFGNNSSVTADSSFAIGTVAVTTGLNSFAIGNGAATHSSNSFAIGRNANIGYSITDALAIGTNATANYSNSIAIGSNTTAANKTIANAASSIALGNTAKSNSTNAIAIGTGATTGYSLTNPIAIGVGAVVNGSNGVAIGSGANTSFVSNATVIGAGASASSTANNSTAIGYNTDVTLPNEIILGDLNNQALSVGIGTESFSGTNREKLLVDAGTTTSVNAIVGKGTIDSYFQTNIQNYSSGANASSDMVATANNGNETSNYIDMGINGGGYSGGVMGGSNDGYLYTMGNNFLLGTGNTSKSLVFLTGGTTQATNERMRIDGTGNVGIGTTSPTQKLDINGNLRFSGAFMPGNNPGTAGYILQSNGSVAPPSWLNAGSYLSSQTWILGGNTVSSTTPIGTDNNFDLPFITNNVERMRLSATGEFAIGTSSFNSTYPEQLLVDAGVTNSVNAIVGKGSINNYLQLNIQNNSAGASASSDVVATANNGSETTNYVDMGINGGGNTSNIMGGADDSYLYNIGQNFLIGAGTSGKAIQFLTGGTSAAANERMRITGTGNVGIGATNPVEKLVVQGNIAPATTGTGTLGTATYKWNTVYATNGVIQTSDKRLKTDIADLSYGLKEVLAMRPVSFYWKATPGTNKKVGLIAQEVKAIIPEVVSGDETKENLGLNYAELVPVLINAVKEQQKEIMELKQMVQKLQGAKK